jgi:hypothetical protein
MAAVTGAVVRKDRDNRMTDKTNSSLTPAAPQPGRLPVRTNNSLAPVANQPGRPPVRVKLRRVNANLATAYPPDGESKVWWRRLKKAIERLRQCLTVAVAGCCSVALRRDFGNRHQCRPRFNRGSGTEE